MRRRIALWLVKRLIEGYKIKRVEIFPQTSSPWREKVSRVILLRAQREITNTQLCAPGVFSDKELFSYTKQQLVFEITKSIQQNPNMINIIQSQTEEGIMLEAHLNIVPPNEAST